MHPFTSFAICFSFFSRVPTTCLHTPLINEILSTPATCNLFYSVKLVVKGTVRMMPLNKTSSTGIERQLVVFAAASIAWDAAAVAAIHGPWQNSGYVCPIGYWEAEICFKKHDLNGFLNLRLDSCQIATATRVTNRVGYFEYTSIWGWAVLYSPINLSTPLASR